MSFGSFGEAPLTQKQLNYILHRQRSLPVIQSAPRHQSQPVITFYQQVLDYSNNQISKSKPSVAIYRPPNLRSDMNNYNNNERSRYTSSSNKNSTTQGKLNVYAKEFTLHNNHSMTEQTTFRNHISSDAIKTEMNKFGSAKSNNDGFQHNRKSVYELNTSKSSGNLVGVLKSSNGSSHNSSKPKDSHFSKQGIQMSTPKSVNFNLQRTKSSGGMLLSNEGNRYHFKESDSKYPILKTQNMAADKKSNRHHFKESDSKYPILKTQNMAADKKVAFLTSEKSSFLSDGIGLKRSKSLSSTDSMQYMLENLSISHPVTFTEFNSFPTDLHSIIKLAIKDPNEMPDRNIMLLARKVLEHATNNRRSVVPAAKLSVVIVEKDKNSTYLDTMLNTCQLWFEERKKRLRNNPLHFTTFLTFINEFYNQIKRSQLELKLKFDDSSPSRTLLNLISKCCHDLLTYTEKHTLSEVECLYFVLTSVGRDLENELHNTALQLHNTIKDVFLKNKNNPQVKKTLLELIELRAAKWQQLPMSALTYYYPKSNPSSSS